MNDDYANTGVAEPAVEKEKASPSSSVSARAASRNGHDGTTQTQRKAMGPPKTIWREYFESAVVTVIMALFGMTFIVQAVKVPTGSMQNTITIGDHLLVNKFIFAPGPPLPFLPQREIKRGDIIVFKYPGNSNQRLSEQTSDPENIPFKTNYVKRVIGLPGDRVEIRDDRVYINDKLLPEHRITAVDHDDNPSTLQAENNAPLEVRDSPPRKADEPYSVYYSINRSFDSDKKFVVPPDSYFVMGDNRNNSSDSRVWGYVKREYVVGRAMFVYWSYDESAPSTNIFSNFFSNTRWGRTGTMIK
jgi:signal peptidase I